MAIRYVSYDPEQPVDSGASDDDIQGLVSSVFREESGKMVASLVCNFGHPYLRLAERIVQDAFLASHRRWLARGVPRDPKLSIWKTARSKALEILLGEGELDHKKYSIMEEKEGSWSTPRFFVIERKPGDLAMLLFACSGSGHGPTARRALMLNLLGGLTSAETGGILGFTESDITTMLSRAKDSIEADPGAFEVPSGDVLDGTLKCVGDDMFAVFKMAQEPAPTAHLLPQLNKSLIGAMSALLGTPGCGSTDLNAIQAYMMFIHSRLPASRGPGGKSIPLEKQDRSLWSPRLISRALRHLHTSAEGSSITPFHMEAGIEACYSLAEDYDSTDWPKLLNVFDSYRRFGWTDDVALRHAVVLARVEGPNEGIKAIKEIKDLDGIEGDTNPYEVLGELYMSIGEHKGALISFDRALEAASGKAQRRQINKKIMLCKEKITIANKYHLARAF